MYTEGPGWEILLCETQAIITQSLCWGYSSQSPRQVLIKTYSIGFKESMNNLAGEIVAKPLALELYNEVKNLKNYLYNLYMSLHTLNLKASWNDSFTSQLQTW